MPTLVSELDTPAVVIDLDIVEANIKRAQDILAGHGLNNRPHIKTHKIPALAKKQFEGLMTFPTAKPEQRLWLERAMQLLNGAGIPVPVVSGGGSPALKGCGDFPMLTEYRAGTYIYNDVMQVTAGGATWEDCAMTVRATVVSRPTETRAVFDAGSKMMTSEQYYAKGFGRVVEYPDAQVTGFSEEHGILDLSACARKPQIGETISVIPNHCCVVTNMMDEV